MVGDKTIDIPLIALISHHYLAMDNVQIKFKAKVGSVESQIPENNLLLSSPQRANLQMQMSNIKPDADDVMWKIHSPLPPSVHFKVIPQIHSKVTP